nr:TatD family hydrolase [Lysobacter sp. CAU 1642]
MDVDEFAEDRPAVLDRARRAGVEEQLVPAIDRAHWPALAALVEAEPGLYPAYGLHPMFLDEGSDDDLAALPGFLDRHPAAAIGECGLDHYVEGLDRERQLRVFRGQLRLARERDLPLVVHARRAVDLVIAEIRNVGGLRGVVHSFSGSAEQAAQLYRLGFSLGLGGPVTYERARRLRALVAEMPIDHLLLETDAPDQPPSWRRGQRNEPGELPRIGATIAALRGIAPQDLAVATRDNARRLFVR